jgi:hypothetical protein
VGDSGFAFIKKFSRPALAITTAMYGKKIAPNINAHRRFPDAKIAPTKQIVLKLIEIK